MTSRESLATEIGSAARQQRGRVGWRARGVGNLGLWLLALLLGAITFSHYSSAGEAAPFLIHLIEDLGLSRWDFERILYIIPMVWSGFLFGRKGVLVTAAASLAGMLPRAAFFSPHQAESLFEAGVVFVVGGWAGLSSALLVEERDRHLQMAALYRVSSVVAGSLELAEILESGIANLMQVLKADAVMVFLKDTEADDLRLTAHRGISPQLAESCAHLPLGEGLNGTVARTGEPLFVEDTLTDPRLAVHAVRDARIRSQLIVPLRAHGQVLGTLCVATYDRRRFRPGEVDLLAAIGNHIGVAVEKARLYAHMQRMQESLRNYVHEITRAQEEERRRIARELHDDTIQALVIHSRRLDELASAESVGSDDWRAKLEDLRQQINGIIDDVRRLSRDLRPAILDRLGLLPALERLASEVTQHSQVLVRVESSGVERRLPAEVELALFRIAQEALRNVWRHAGASRAEVKVEFAERKVRLVVVDDGKGFARPSTLVDLPRHGKLGLAGIEERTQLLGGTLRVDSELGKGTTLTVEVPL